MLIARVVGEVVATVKHASHEGCKLLLVQPLNLDGSDRGDAVVAVDAVDAGAGDRVLLVMEGFSAMTSVGRPQSPIDMAVIGVIQNLNLVFASVVPPNPTPGPQDQKPPQIETHEPHLSHAEQLQHGQAVRL